MEKRLIVISNILAFASILCLMATGTVMRWILPPGSGGGAGHGAGLGRGRHLLEGDHVKTFLGWGRHDWGNLHLWLAVIFLWILGLHLIMNWPWIKHTFFSKKPNPQSLRTQNV